MTLKLKKRKENAKEPPKFLGHGSCHNLSKSVDLTSTTRDASTIHKSGMSLFEMMPIESIHDVRGMGLTLSKLDEDGEQPQPAVAGIKEWLNNSSPSRKGNPAAVPRNFQDERPTDAPQTLRDSDDPDDSLEDDTLKSVAAISHFEEELISVDEEESVEESSESDFDPALLPPIVEKVVDSYHEDLLPLTGFLKDNEPEDEAAKQRVFDFLSIIVNERPAGLKPM
ncbi:MAG: hypothetical protein SGILL_010786, partial [Bacillariaceae sp.]